MWGTHLELKAAATLFQLPIYCCIQQSLQHEMPFSWNVVQPISLNLKLPHIIDEVAQEREEISHIELFYHNGHYHAIVSLESGKMYTEAPRLTGLFLLFVFFLSFFLFVCWYLSLPLPCLYISMHIFFFINTLKVLNHASRTLSCLPYTNLKKSRTEKTWLLSMRSRDSLEGK